MRKFIIPPLAGMGAIFLLVVSVYYGTAFFVEDAKVDETMGFVFTNIAVALTGWLTSYKVLKVLDKND